MNGQDEPLYAQSVAGLLAQKEISTDMRGIAVAVNGSTELLTLFTRLFGDTDQKLELDPKTEPPKTSATLRSLRGSMFGSRSDKPARIISATNRVYKWSGLNNLEQLENAPEYDAGISLQDLLRRLTFDVVR